MKNIVVVPCWRRAEFLSVTLDYLKEANNAANHLYLFCVDRGHNPEVPQVINQFPLEKMVRIAPFNRYKGNSFNVLGGYKHAMSLCSKYNSELIYLVEEDIFCGKDFFTFHEKVQQQHGCQGFFVSAVKNQNCPHPPPASSPKSSVFCHNTYQSLGVSWRPCNLQSVMQYACPEYYGNMLRLLLKVFPRSKYRTGCPEQDGLINRVMERDKKRGLFPYVPRAYHAGFWGYNRKGQALVGPLQERINKIRSMSDEEMNKRAFMHKDIQRCSLEDYGVDNFQLIP